MREFRLTTTRISFHRCCSSVWETAACEMRGRMNPTDGSAFHASQKLQRDAQLCCNLALGVCRDWEVRVTEEELIKKIVSGARLHCRGVGMSLHGLQQLKYSPRQSRDLASRQAISNREEDLHLL